MCITKMGKFRIYITDGCKLYEKFVQVNSRTMLYKMMKHGIKQTMAMWDDISFTASIFDLLQESKAIC